MPKVNGPAFRALLAEADWSPEHMAELLDLAPGSFRNVIAGREPTTDRKIFRAARGLSAQLRREVTYRQLVAEDGVPDSPPGQPKPKPKPPRRREKAGKAPKRPESEAEQVA